VELSQNKYWRHLPPRTRLESTIEKIKTFNKISDPNRDLLLEFMDYLLKKCVIYPTKCPPHLVFNPANLPLHV